MGAGLWAPDPAALARYRAAVADDRTGRALEEVVRELRSTGIEVTAHEVLRRAPKGYLPDHPRIDLLRCKGIVAWRQWPPGPWLGTARAKARVVEFLRATRPLVAWLRDNVG